MRVFREGKGWFWSLVFYALGLAASIGVLHDEVSSAYETFSGICFVGLCMHFSRPIKEGHLLIFEDHCIGVDSRGKTTRYEFSELEIKTNTEYVTLKSRGESFFVGFWWQDFDEIHFLFKKLAEEKKASHVGGVE